MSDYYEEDEGIHFDPDDDELINHYLIPKLRGKLCEDFIVMKNVYAMEPWLLDHNMDPFFQKNEWYYFVTRTQVSEKKIGCGKKAKRKIIGDNDGIDRGNWKANATTNVKDKKTGKIIGIKQTLTFITSNNNKKQKREDGTCAIVPGSNSSWIMKEYMLPEGDTFQELVLCKIKIKKSKKKDDHHEASTFTYHHHESVLASSSSSSEQQPINIDHEINKSNNEEASGLIAAGEGNIPIALERCENLRSEKNDQLHINAPLVSLGHESSLPIGSEEEAKDEEETDWFQYFDLRVEEGQNLLDWIWCDATKSSQLS